MCLYSTRVAPVVDKELCQHRAAAYPSASIYNVRLSASMKAVIGSRTG